MTGPEAKPPTLVNSLRACINKNGSAHRVEGATSVVDACHLGDEKSQADTNRSEVRRLVFFSRKQ